MPKIQFEMDGETDRALEAYAKAQNISKRVAAQRLFLGALASAAGQDLAMPEAPQRGGWRGNPKSLENLHREG